MQASKILAYNIIKAPILTEKSYAAQSNSCYVFIVDKLATKSAVSKAIEALYAVSVDKVNVVRYAPRKLKKMKGYIHQRAIKKAYVTLMKGQVIDFEKVV